MKCGFLNTPQAEKLIEEVHMPWSPPGPEPPRQAPSPPDRTHEDTEDAFSAVEGAVVVVEDVCRSDAGEQLAVHTAEPTEEKGGLSLLDQDNGPEAEPPQDGTTEDTLERVVDTEEDATDTSDNDDSVSLPPRPPHRRPGWGSHPDEYFFHTVPEQYGDPNKKRAVFREWPRDPDGQVLMSKEPPRGTLSPDGYPWGATLYDFYNVRVFPGHPKMSTTMTGSALREVMEELGELDAARSQIEWAKSEGKPRAIGVADTEMLIEDIEMGPWLRTFHNRATPGDTHEMALDHDDEAEDESDVEYDDDTDSEADTTSIPCTSAIPITSPFHPSHYPPPWPLTPFETPLSILLQERIPLYLLPQTLYVHDPFNLLSACEQRFGDTSWHSRPDIVRTYHLNLSECIRKEVETTRRKARELEECKARTRVVMRYKRTREQIENQEPVIEVSLPPHPRYTTKVEESHLYLSPVAKVGKGHHSIVYKGEWELPRDLFARPKLCSQCFQESVDEEVQKLKDIGRWGKGSEDSAVRSSPLAFTGREPMQTAELNATDGPDNLGRDGAMIERELICTVPPNMLPSEIFEIIDRGFIWDLLVRFLAKNGDRKIMRMDFTEKEDPNAATIRVHPSFSLDSQKTCTHDLHPFPIPRVARFTVIAKLSLEHDSHLAREASNYQQFPERFFHHFDGYTLMSQLPTIVPVSAVVPQFYGHYTPMQDGGENHGSKPYLSPILLLEHCGEPITPKELTKEDQAECASLLLRFHRARWLHESVAPRNFLVQRGKPTEFPAMRKRNPQPSFRLIDFGRSRRIEEAWEKRDEEIEALEMFHRLKGRMKVTLVDFMM